MVRDQFLYVQEFIVSYIRLRIQGVSVGFTPDVHCFIIKAVRY